SMPKAGSCRSEWWSTPPDYVTKRRSWRRFVLGGRRSFWTRRQQNLRLLRSSRASLVEHRGLMLRKRAPLAQSTFCRRPQVASSNGLRNLLSNTAYIVCWLQRTGCPRGQAANGSILTAAPASNFGNNWTG